MQIARREFLATAPGIALFGFAQTAQGAPQMYGLIAKLVAVPNRRDDLIAILTQGTASMSGCLSYVIAKDMADENTIWVTEVWDSAADHDASLSLPAVKESIVKGKPLVAEFSRIAVTSPVAGVSKQAP